MCYKKNKNTLKKALDKLAKGQKAVVNDGSSWKETRQIGNNTVSKALQEEEINVGSNGSGMQEQYRRFVELKFLIDGVSLCSTGQFWLLEYKF